MIQQKSVQSDYSSWQEALKKAITSPYELCDILHVSKTFIPGALEAGKIFTCKVPMSFVNRMKKGDPYDPLLRQVLPVQEELIEHSEFIDDPLGEKEATKLPGLLHKYNGRILITLAGACAVNCRYCFRRTFPYSEQVPGRSGLIKILEYIKQDSRIKEIILSGGDPLIVPDDYLRWFISCLEKVEHVDTLRFHTRLPIMIPERITKSLVGMLVQSKLKIVFVFHINHANELIKEINDFCCILSLNGITLLSQAVLLRGINDDLDTLETLSRQLFHSQIMPYYLHMPDKVKGTTHFDVPVAKAKSLLAGLTARLPGYLVPKLVQEKPGYPSKVIVPIEALSV